MNKPAGEIVREEFRKMLRQDLQEEIDDIPIAELGIDSLDFYEKLLYLEDEFGINIPIAELDSTVTLRSMIALLDP